MKMDWGKKKSFNKFKKSTVDIEKKIKNLKKKRSEIKKLKNKILTENYTPTDAQKQKISKDEELENEINALKNQLKEVKTRNNFK